MIYSCEMCAFKSLSQVTTVQHTVRCHRFDVAFMAICCYRDCQASYHNWNSFQSHIKRKHKYEDLPVPNDEPQDEPVLDQIFNHPGDRADDENINQNGKSDTIIS